MLLFLSSICSLASMLQDPWSCRNTGHGAKSQAQNLVVGPTPNTDTPRHLLLKRDWAGGTGQLELFSGALV